MGEGGQEVVITGGDQHEAATFLSTRWKSLIWEILHSQKGGISLLPLDFFIIINNDEANKVDTDKALGYVCGIHILFTFGPSPENSCPFAEGNNQKSQS